MHYEQTKLAVQQQFALMAKHPLMQVDIPADELFAIYLAALPEDERDYANCTNCRKFMSNYGNIVAIIDGKIATIWDVADQVQGIYVKAMKAAAKAVRKANLKDAFLTDTTDLGVDRNMGVDSSGNAVAWTHYYLKLPNSLKFVGKSVAGEISKLRGTRDVFRRSLQELKLTAIDTVLDLIKEKALYRGLEYRDWVTDFRAHFVAYAALDEKAKELYVWAHYRAGGKIRNSAIGTILVDISDGMDLEEAVRRFHTSVVAPANFGHSTALASRTQVESAKAQLEEAGLTNALERRHATLDDIPLKHVLYVHRKSKTKASALDEMAEEVSTVSKASLNKAAKVSLDKFLKEIMPNTNTLELYVEKSQNFASLIAPVDNEAPSLFNWGNSISWTYQNNMADAIAERVKRAGGSVDGVLGISLSWFNHDDLDLSVAEPCGATIDYRAKHSRYGSGNLDVDMNAIRATTREPVENIIYPHFCDLQNGEYVVRVKNFAKREFSAVGFELRISVNGEVNVYHWKASPRDGESETVATMTVKGTNIEVRVHGNDGDGASSGAGASAGIKAGLKTNKFHPVTLMLKSPNYWTAKSGNEHLFVILKGAKIEEPLRPFFNEYLRTDLRDIRKVFETLAGKMQVQPADNQVTGVGVSLSQKACLYFKADKIVYAVEI